MKCINKITIGVMLIVLASCASLKVQKMNEVKEPKANQLAYTLPKASIQFKFTFTKYQFIPGPYADYTRQFLEVDPPKKRQEIWWELGEIEHELLTSKDTSQAYAISGNVEKITPENWTQLLNFQVMEEDSQSFVTNKSGTEQDLYFSELTLKKLIIEESKTSYKMITVDSVRKRVPVVNTVLRNKTMEELAKDAAKSLTKIRKRKFRLMAGMNEKLPKSKALELMLEELDKKEQQYLELFIGKTVSHEFIYRKEIYPDHMGSYPLMSWNRISGPTNKVIASDQVVLNIHGEALPNDSIEENLKYAKFLPFKSASNTPISVTYKNKTIYSAVVQFPQLGELQYLPLDFLKNKTIKLNPKTGVLQNIQ